MPYLNNDKVRIYYEETGSGEPIVFVHEGASDYREWEQQVRFFSRYYRCITFNARGYQPSDCPADENAYGHEFAVDDIRAVLTALKLERPFLVGVSQGSWASLVFALSHPQRCKGLVLTACGTGAPAADRERIAREMDETAARIQREGLERIAMGMEQSPTRAQLARKDPRSWQQWLAHFKGYSPTGLSNSLRKFQGQRPSLFDFEAKLRACDVPTLLIAGDEDDPVLETNLFLKRTMPRSGLWVVPLTGHAVNLEEPAHYHLVINEFFAAVERNKWPRRDQPA
jgi:pimeloyl-ACP methyl ester carboxylesterase